MSFLTLFKRQYFLYEFYISKLNISKCKTLYLLPIILKYICNFNLYWLIIYAFKAKKIWDYQLSIIERDDNSILSKNVSIKRLSNSLFNL